jgi:DNA polymerase/3'-5' exonuclease PolX
MPREEVEEIAREVNRHMQIVAPGAIHQIVGGYRRGKPASNDMDILFTRPDGESTSGILDEVVDRLKKAGAWLCSHRAFDCGMKPRRAPCRHYLSYALRLATHR